MWPSNFIFIGVWSKLTGAVDKAKETISEIEEIKRKELQMIQNMQEIHPKWGLIDANSLPPSIPLQVAGEI